MPEGPNPFLDYSRPMAAFVASDGQRLSYVDAGPKEAPVLVLLHGAGMDHRMWALQVDHLEDRFRCLVLDVRGHGRSRPTARDFTLRRCADDVLELLDKLGVDDAVLIGQSMGAMLAQTVARHAPRRVRGIVSVDSVDMSSGWDALSVGMLRTTRPMLNAYPYKMLARRVGKGVGRSYYTQIYAELSLMALGRDDFLRVWRMVAGAVERKPWPDYRSPPLLLVVGRHDTVGYCRKEAQRWANRTQSRLVWLEDAGHNGNQDAPGPCNAALDEFLGALEQREAA